MAMLHLFLLGFIGVTVAVGPLSPIYVHNVHTSIHSAESGNNSTEERKIALLASPKIKFGHKVPMHGKITLTNKFDKKHRNAPSVVTSVEPIVTDEPIVVSFDSQKVRETFPVFSRLTDWNENSLGQYLATLTYYYRSAGVVVPPSTIARVLLRLHNKLPLRSATNREQIPYPLILENFRVNTHPNDVGGMSGAVSINFIQECKICSQNELTMNQLIELSPQQIAQMRLSSDQSDIAWFLGSVAHLLIFQTFPLEEWARQNNIFPENDQIDEKFSMFLLQKNVKKMLNSEEKLQIRTDFSAGSWQNQWSVLVDIMKNSLQTDSEKRTFDSNGKLLKLASNLIQ